MGERIRKADNKSEVKSQNPKSAIQKGHRSRSMVSPVEHILFLQRTMGNHAVQRLMKSGSLQARLRIGQPGDFYEQEADRVAEHVMRMPDAQVPKGSPNSDIAIQRQCPRCKERLNEDEEKLLQTKEAPGRSPEIMPDLEEGLKDLRGGGQPLPENVRAFYEPRFGYDFSNVRMHADARAAEMARVADARAFTVGRDIVFGEREYDIKTSSGQRLMAHELAHVVQQIVGSDHNNNIQFFDQGSMTNLDPRQAEQILALERLRAILRRHKIMQGGSGIQLTRSLSEELQALMSENNIAKLSFPASNIDDVINQVTRLRISLLMEPETAAERIQGILATPHRPRGPPSMSGVLPEWLGLYSAGMVGFHVSVPPVPEPPLEARLTAVFRERGIQVDSRLLRDIMTNYDLGVQELEQLLRSLLPSEYRNQAPNLAGWIAEKLQTVSLNATLRRERPTPIEETSSTRIGSLMDKIREIPAGASITIHF